MKKTNKKTTKKQNRDMSLFCVKVAPAGIGRMRYAAWLEHETVDHQDCFDDDTYNTPGEALKAAAERLDAWLIHIAFVSFNLPP